MVSQINSKFSNKENASDVLNDLSKNVTSLIDEINAIPIANARLVTATLSTTANPVAHLLGYVYRGVIVVKQTASFTVYEDTTATNPDVRNYAMLRTSSGTQSVTLLFF